MPLTIAIAPGVKGADYATRTTPISLSILKSQGVGYVVRYICGNPTSWKQTTPAEVQMLHAAGMPILLVWELAAERPLQGGPAGRRDGYLAAQDAIRLGYPRDVAVLAAFDFNVTAANRSVCVAYWREFVDAYRSVRGPDALVGMYGDWDMIEAGKAESAVNWQPNAWSWSATWIAKLRQWLKRIHPDAHAKQRTTVTVAGFQFDPNDTLRTIRAWLPTNTPTPPDPAPEDDDMAKHYKPDDEGKGGAEFAVSGGVAKWIRNRNEVDALVMGGLLEKGGPHGCARAYLKNLHLAGPAPTYGPNYTGVRTTAADFGSHS